ncbi:MAG TPA: glycyl-radical enzyme activating protein [Clostridiaceae bacterium]|nr:glycyl-radical enzyme activating protein [Clostridiaceae bacterium]
MKKSVVCEIERYAIHDGPGVRTVVFLKGCPLRCAWCSNPETQNPENELYYNQKTCIGCRHCIAACPLGVLTYEEGVRIDRETCDQCGKCVDVCPTGSLNLVGEEMTAEAVLTEVLKDEAFYASSGGGLTITGGEVLMNAPFVLDLLRRAKAECIDTCIETTGYGKLTDLIGIAEYADTVYYDIKHIDDGRHRELTGVGNRVILENLEVLSKLHGQIVIRMPILSGINSDVASVKEAAEFVFGLGIREVHLLPYHALGKGKYTQLGRPYSLLMLKPPGEEEMEELRMLVEACGLKVTIGG